MSKERMRLLGKTVSLNEKTSVFAIRLVIFLVLTFGVCGAVDLNEVVRNALDAMPEGGLLTVATSAMGRNGQEMAQVEVQDTGCGTRVRLSFPLGAAEEGDHAQRAA